MVYLLRVRASGWSLRIVLAAWWGRSLLRGEAVCPSPSVLTPYSPGHASTTMWRGWGGVTRWSREVGEAVGHSHSLLLDLSCPTLFYRHPRWLNASPAPAPTLPRPPTKCCNLTSLTKGNIYEQD